MYTCTLTCFSTLILRLFGSPHVDPEDKYSNVATLTLAKSPFVNKVCTILCGDASECVFVLHFFRFKIQHFTQFKEKV